MARVSEWVLGAFGAFAVFLGLFILFGGENQYIGFGEGMNWRVGDIAPAWAYGLLAAGVVLLAVVVTLVVLGYRRPRIR